MTDKRKYEKSTYTDDWPCARCGRRFFGTFTTRHPKYCPDCKVIITRDGARERKRKQRQQERNKAQMMQPLRELEAKYKLPASVRDWQPARKI